MTTGWGADSAQAAEAAGAKLSLRCWLYRDKPHNPCSGTTDDGSGAPCGCRCHAKLPACPVRRILAAMIVAMAAFMTWAAAGGPPPAWAFYTAALSAVIVAFIAFTQDHAFHIEQTRMNEHHAKLERMRADLIRAAQEIGVRLDSPE